MLELVRVRVGERGVLVRGALDMFRGFGMELARMGWDGLECMIPLYTRMYISIL